MRACTLSFSFSLSLSFLLSLSVSACTVGTPPFESIGATTIATSGPLSVAEGQTGSFTVQLAGDAPEGELTVSLTPQGAMSSVEPSRLVFDATDFERPRTVIVRSLVDADLDFAAGAISLTAPGIATATVPVRVVEPDIIAVDLAQNIACPQEPVDMAVWLNGNPREDLTLDVASSPGTYVDAERFLFEAAVYDSDQGTVVIPYEGPATAQITVSTPDKLASTTVTLSVRSALDPACP